MRKIIGEGASLFEGLKQKVEFKLLDTRVSKNGNVLLGFQPLKTAV